MEKIIGPPRNPFSLLSIMIGKKIDYSKIKDPYQLLADVFEINKKDIYNPIIEGSPAYGKKYKNINELKLTENQRETLKRYGIEYSLMVPNWNIIDCSLEFKIIAEVSDPVQGDHEDCGLISALAAVAFYDESLITKDVYYDANGQIDQKFLVIPYHFHAINGNLFLTNIVISKSLPAFYRHYIGCYDEEGDECWPPLYEKAFALVRYAANNNNGAISSQVMENDSFMSLPPSWPSNIEGFDPLTAIESMTSIKGKRLLLDIRVESSNNEGRFAREYIDPQNQYLVKSYDTKIDQSGPDPINVVLEKLDSFCLSKQNDEDHGSVYDKTILAPGVPTWITNIIYQSERIMIPSTALTYGDALPKDFPPGQSLAIYGNSKIIYQHCYTVLGFLKKKVAKEYVELQKVPNLPPDDWRVVHLLSELGDSVTSIVLRDPLGSLSAIYNNACSNAGFQFIQIDRDLFTPIPSPTTKTGIFALEMSEFMKLFKELNYAPPSLWKPIHADPSSLVTIQQ
jgi:hypothetical protein